MKVLIIGDVCTDEHIYGECKRLCPEAPVPVFNPIKIIQGNGMSGNVQKNIEKLNIETDLICNSFKPTKTRYIDEHTNQMFLRVDKGENLVDWIEFKLDNINWSEYDAVIISDYNKGFLTETDILYISRNHSLTFMDTKKKLDDWAENITYIKLNSYEYSINKKILHENKKLFNKVIVTVGPDGCIFQEKKYPVEKVDVKDLSGAGDTFLAGLVADYLKNGNDIIKAIEFANKCATVVVQKRGVACL